MNKEELKADLKTLMNKHRIIFSMIDFADIIDDKASVDGFYVEDDTVKPVVKVESAKPLD